MATNKFNGYILVVFFTVLVLESLFAIKNSHANVGINPTASNVYVLSNRETTIQNNSNTTLNSVSGKSGLDFMKANSYSKDSLKITSYDSADFLSEISSIEGNWVLFVHGDAKTLDESIVRGVTIKELYDINVLIFSWPSKDPNLHGAKNFKRSQAHVGESLNHFVQVLEFVDVFREVNSSFPNEQRITLLLHSLGNLYLEKMINRDLYVDLSNKLFENIIINAAAVNQEKHKEWVENLNIQDHIFITCNKQDFNLKGVHIFTKDGKQLGEKITHPLACNANYIHFNKAVGFKFPTSQTHTYFIGEIPDKDENIKEFYYGLMHGEHPNLNDVNKFLLRKDNLGYEILPK